MVAAPRGLDSPVAGLAVLSVWWQNLTACEPQLCGERAALAEIPLALNHSDISGHQKANGLCVIL